MAGPITWQNVGQANFGDAAGFMQMSSQNANQAFSSAIKRTAEQEAKVKAGKTNALANQIYGITDPETLRAFQSKINLEDPTIDSNVINDAVLKQGSILESRAVNASNIAQNNQQIEASKIRSDVDVATLGLTAADQAFNRGIKTRELTLEEERQKQANATFATQQAKAQVDLRQAQKTDYANELAGKAFAVYSQGGDPEAQFAQAYKDTNDLTVLVQARETFDKFRANSETLSPAENEAITRLDNKFNQEKLVKAKAGEDEKAAVREKYKEVPKDLIDTKAAMVKSGRTSYEAVVTDFVEELKKVDESLAEEFATQSPKWTSSNNEGAIGILNTITDRNSPINVAYQIAIGKRKEVYNPSTSGTGKGSTTLKLAAGVKESELPVISPLELKMALKAVSPAGNLLDDGINVELLAKEAAKYKSTLTELDSMEKEIENIDKSYLRILAEKDADKEKEKDALRNKKRFSTSNAVKDVYRGKSDLYPIDMEDARNTEIGY